MLNHNTTTKYITSAPTDAQFKYAVELLGFVKRSRTLDIVK